MASRPVVPIVRRSARAVLIDDEARLVTIKRTKPGAAPYWTTPGGGIESDDPSRQAALERELLEELGATAVVGQEVTLVTTPADGGQSVQYFFAARLIRLDASLRSGDEYADAGRGGYEVERIPLDQLAEYDLRPAKIKDFISENRAALLAAAGSRRCDDQFGAG
ncbi:8-oxo-dGTP pyrophosphatase MutT, NUDIX family [Parafrankia irregularis]|uniref:8-oxo-dGTP pyrophosphatase MutT, NUDIX family n=1 Tax=Parafrankia irregularis TaxID=795642 RepID=A0A0S4QY84_9ACTN|nr:NUDIX domain-containing protein [Frankia sp. R43]KPM53144.1 NUDIX hydrolase [Frankia sp. R43]MBE3204665.1 NUDIX domain-containing protein [Parafrankia sp. CH37]CUU60603.1 8-oxo-dGTP pyrophosphatase MutT, NUDIX family [Parafrankia irregularis]